MTKLETSLKLFTAMLASSVAAHAAINIQTSYVGDAGNSADSTGYGAVSYGYHVGTYEVTNSQYVSFLNEVASVDEHELYHPYMGSRTYGGIYQCGVSGSFAYMVKPGMEDLPVNYVSFWDAARFANWLTSGDTEVGVYNLTQTGILNNTITRDATAWNAGGVAIASEDEWYKAAYYQPLGAGGDTDSYWLYPTASNVTPSNDLIEPDPGNNANFVQSDYTVGNPIYLTNVGAFENSASYYGTFDQCGNVSEWNEEILSIEGGGRITRGGSSLSSDTFIQSSSRSAAVSTTEQFTCGFRVTSLAPIAYIPPASSAMLHVYSSTDLDGSWELMESIEIENAPEQLFIKTVLIPPSE